MSVELKKITQLTWRKLMLSNEGQEAMLYLREKCPTIQKGQADEMIFEAGKVEGYRMALDMISEIIAATPSKEQSLDND